MSLTNLSQVLLRNDDLLIANFPLLINMPDDNFASELNRLKSDNNVTFFDTHFGNHLQRKKFTFANAVFTACYETKLKHDLVIMTFPKSKKELAFTLAMVAPKLADNARILVIGENKSGIKSLDKLVKDQATYVTKIDSARHCILFEMALNHQMPFDLQTWFSTYTFNHQEIQCKIAALPGVFSQAKLDKGTEVLFDVLPDDINGKVLDFGTGAGVIATLIGKKFPTTELHLADVSALALASAEKSLALNGLSGNVFATDSMSNIRGNFDTVITNPPFHQGLKTHYAATETFLKQIAQFVNVRGKMLVVANSFLSYEPLMRNNFSQICRLIEKKGFTVYRADKK
ncbi:methyltransferase [Thalassotalea marina]|uniref:Ribosomal RNA small subunit methyltransferase C n=1 Tax=Thalassotalea marina TaxID=1673741 RepID=A0A919BAA2_9GAMM|nr:methyltransferase [Thalassotalea marina]GHF78547.1 ribosomal RNA small subunit methyltransferase C [Thalassotalea marina]